MDVWADVTCVVLHPEPDMTPSVQATVLQTFGEDPDSLAVAQEEDRRIRLGALEEMTTYETETIHVL